MIRLQDENIFRKMEELINKSLNPNDEPIRRFTKKELIERAKKSNVDYQAGKVRTQEQLEADSKSW